jgi:arabinofuranosyltransferase
MMKTVPAPDGAKRAPIPLRALLAGASEEVRAGRSLTRAIPIVLIALAAIVLLRTAWMSDDSYITLRTVDNFVNGHGLRWNVDERVQAFTHPLWLFVISLPYLFTRDGFYTTVVLSLILSLAAFTLLLLRSKATPTAAAVCGLTLLLSRAFVDYSTSGLENPLTHLLLVLFLLRLTEERPAPRALLVLAGIAGLAAANRADSILLFAPGIVLATHRFGWRRGLPLVATGFLPFVLWVAFSLFYYGLPYPNTALAKLNTGIDSLALLGQGLHYFASSLRIDPVTPAVIAASFVAAAVRRRGRDVAVALGILLYLLYVLRIGGDFMSGRYLSAPLLASAALLMQIDPLPVRRGRAALAALVLVIAAVTPHPSFLSGRGYGAPASESLDKSGIADERRFYFPTAGLFNRSAELGKPARTAAATGLEARRAKSPLLVEGVIGLTGYFAGPEVHIVDYHALADPLLARLPAVAVDPLYGAFMRRTFGGEDPKGWRIGHFLRSLPGGYLATLASGKNRLEDADLARLYDRISLVTRGSLWSAKRMAAIASLNLRRHAVGRTDRSEYKPPDWTEVIDALPDLAGPYVRRAEQRAQAGQTDLALADLDRALRLDPRDQGALDLYGRIQIRRGNLAAVVAAWERFVQVDPTSPVPYMQLGDLCLRSGQPDRAIAYFKDAILRDPKLTTAYNNIGVAYAQLGRYDDAVSWMRRALELAPGSGRLLEDLGTAYLNAGDSRRAIEAWEEAIRFEPDLESAIQALGIAYADGGDVARARALLERAIRLNPEDAEALYRLGLLVETKGEREKGEAYIRKAARLGFEPAQKVLSDRGRRP